MNYEKTFAKNLKKFRTKLVLTQRELGERCGYSDKTVSKWETGKCLPSIDALLRVSTALRTDINTLLKDDETVYYLGIDGGGTKTDLVLANESGKVIREAKAEQCNPFDVGFEKTKKVLTDSIYEICKDIPLSSVIAYAGIAGTVAGDFSKSFKALFDGMGFKGYDYGSDNENIIKAGLGNCDGVTVIMGTGICVFAVKGNEKHRISGWGYLFDDGGSAYNVGRDALHAYFSQIDGSGEPTSLYDRISSMEESSGSLLTRLYKEGKKAIASYATIVFEEAVKGDKVSCDIIERNVSIAVELIKTAVNRVGQPCKCVVAGGLAQSVIHRLNEMLRGITTAELLSVKPVMGALEKAKEIKR